MNDIRLYENVPELKNSAGIKVRKYKATWFGQHWHEHIELLHILRGGGRFVCGATVFSASEGETVAVNSNELHAMTDGDAEYICIIISPEILAEVSSENTIFRSAIPRDKYVSQRFEKIFEEYTAHRLGAELAIRGEVCLLAVYMMRNYAAAHLSDYEYGLHLTRMKKANAILDFIGEHYAEPLGAAELAAKFFVSESHLCRIFKNAVGMTVTEYINRFRTEKAAVLLKNTDESVTEIAAECGFENLNYFSRIFRRYKGMTPSQFRQFS